MSTMLTPVERPRRGGVRFGPSLRAARKVRGETLDEAARGIGIYASTLNRLERGQRGAGDAITQAICRYYASSLESLRAR